MKHLLILFLPFLLVKVPLYAQVHGKVWPTSSKKHELQGEIKTWTMKYGDDVIRKREYDRQGQLISDTYHESEQTFVPDYDLPEHKKNEFEKICETIDSLASDSNEFLLFNDRGQLLEKKTVRPRDNDDYGMMGVGDRTLLYHIKNRFDENGKLLSNRIIHHISSTRAWNSMHHPEPFYTYETGDSCIALYEYNKAGKLIEFEYYHSNVIKDLRIIYIYDENNNLIECLSYDDHNISRKYFYDAYLNPIWEESKNSHFDINKVCPDFWMSDGALRETWKYDSNNSKIEYVYYDSHQRPDGKTIWEYNDEGVLTKSKTYTLHLSFISAEMLYDERGNIVEETKFDNRTKEEHKYHYEIEYY